MVLFDGGAAGRIQQSKVMPKTVSISKALITLPRRRAAATKADTGRVLIVGGSPEYSGALALAGIAAMRSGAGSVIVAAPEKVAWAINAFSADLVTRKLPGERLSLKHFRQFKPYLAKADCLLVGNGVAEIPTSMALLRKVIQAFPGLKVLDAAALFAFEPKRLTNAILLPNQPEFRRLARRCSISRLLAQGNVVVQKSHRSRVLTKDKVLENRTGNPGLAKAGTGDVLAGLTAGFLAQSKDLIQSAINAVYFIGQTADVLFKKKKGYYYLASDVAEELKRLRR